MGIRVFITRVIVFCLLVVGSAQAHLVEGRPQFALDIILISLQPGTNPETYFGADYAKVEKFRYLADAYKYRLNAATEQEVLDECARRAKDPEVRYAEPNYYMYIDDPLVINPPVLFDPNNPDNLTNRPPYIAPPPVLLQAPAGLVAGNYTATVKVQRSIESEGLSSKQTLSGTATVGENGTITILLTSPLTVQGGLADAHVIRAVHSPQETANYLVGNLSALVSVAGKKVTLAYSVTTSLNGTSEPGLKTTVEATLRKR